MTKVSILDIYKKDIEALIETGASIRSVWKIICSKIPTEQKISYDGFYKYCKRKGIS